MPAKVNENVIVYLRPSLVSTNQLPTTVPGTPRVCWSKIIEYAVTVSSLLKKAGMKYKMLV